ncbi:hypothetical protein BLOT_011292 [Blomia tropicalis]|nr:hypothetical protein BLOT_011292 [Blomia tropicalis]
MYRNTLANSNPMGKNMYNYFVPHDGVCYNVFLCGIHCTYVCIVYVVVNKLAQLTRFTTTTYRNELANVDVAYVFVCMVGCLDVHLHHLHRPQRNKINDRGQIHHQVLISLFII